MSRPLLGLLSVVPALLAAAAPPAVSLAIVNGTVLGPDGWQRKGQTVLIAGDRIRAVNALGAPTGVPTLDARGCLVTAGLFDAASRVGLAELGEDDAADDAAGGDRQHPVTAALRVADGFYPQATAIPVTRVDGITTAALLPKGGLISGQAAVVDLAGATDDGVVVKPNAGLVGSVSPTHVELPGPNGRPRVWAAWRELLAYARAHRADVPAELPFGMGLLDFRAVQQLAAGKTPLYLTAHRGSDILAALRLAKEERLSIVLFGAEEGWMVAKQIAAARVPVVLDQDRDLPYALERRGSRLDNAALLHDAGVRVALGTWSQENARNLRQAAGLAVANGLPWATAWQAVTREPARIHGVAATHGDLAPGKLANVVLWTGDPFEPATDVKGVVIHGRPITLMDRQTALARRYLKLPR